MVRLAVTAVLALAVAAPALAQAPQTEEESERIVVLGRRTDGVAARELAREFVIEIADTTTSQNGYARWETRVCVGVENIPEDAAQFVADRVSEVALELGLRAGGPGCRPNIMIVFVGDGADYASRLVEADPTMFRPFGGVAGTTQGLEALNEFATSDAPVRWWRVTMVIDESGMTAVGVPHQLNGPPVVRGSNSLITNSVSDAIISNYLVVDVSKLGGANWTQLTDYLALVALGQVDADARPEDHDSILNLFDSAAPPSGLTEWDWSYLHALYELDTRRTPRLQPGALVSLMAREQAEAEDAE